MLALRNSSRNRRPTMGGIHCATLLFAMGVEAATVQRILRHSSITVTTGTDVDVIEEVQRVAVSGMNELSGIQGVDGSRDDRIMRLLSSRTSEALSWNKGKGL